MTTWYHPLTDKYAEKLDHEREEHMKTNPTHTKDIKDLQKSEKEKYKEGPSSRVSAPVRLKRQSFPHVKVKL